jgi:hypothetical protein
MATFYLGYEFVKATVQTSSGGGSPTVVATVLQFPNKIAPSTENKTYQWEGGGKVEKLESLVGISYDLSLDCIPQSAHATIFSKTAVTGGLPSGVSAAYGYGGGNDARGVAAGLLLEGNAIKDVDGARSTVKFVLWLPVGTLTLKTPPGMTSGNKFELLGYNFAATKTTTNIIGATLTGASTDGEFFVLGETT